MFQIVNLQFFNSFLFMISSLGRQMTDCLCLFKRIYWSVEGYISVRYRIYFELTGQKRIFALCLT